MLSLRLNRLFLLLMPIPRKWFAAFLKLNFSQERAIAGSAGIPAGKIPAETAALPG
jgi:hypothetical protein